MYILYAETQAGYTVGTGTTSIVLLVCVLNTTIHTVLQCSSKSSHFVYHLVISLIHCMFVEL